MPINFVKKIAYIAIDTDDDGEKYIREKQGNNNYIPRKNAQLKKHYNLMENYEQNDIENYIDGLSDDIPLICDYLIDTLNLDCDIIATRSSLVDIMLIPYTNNAFELNLYKENNIIFIESIYDTMKYDNVMIGINNLNKFREIITTNEEPNLQYINKYKVVHENLHLNLFVICQSECTTKGNVEIKLKPVRLDNKSNNAKLRLWSQCHLGKNPCCLFAKYDKDYNIKKFEIEKINDLSCGKNIDICYNYLAKVLYGIYNKLRSGNYATLIRDKNSKRIKIKII